MECREIRLLLNDAAAAGKTASEGPVGVHELQLLLTRLASATTQLLEEREQLNRRLRRRAIVVPSDDGPTG